MSVSHRVNKGAQDTLADSATAQPGFLSGLKRFMVFMLLLTVFVAGGFGSWKIWQILDVPVALISIKGDFNYASQHEISRLVEVGLKGGFLSADLDSIRMELEESPWVESAKISRQWPDGLVIVIQEEVPIARWNADGFLNRRGEALQLVDNSGLSALPKLTGPEGGAQQVMEQYRHAAQILSPAGLKTIEFHLDERNAWHLEVNNGLQVAVGQGDVTEKLKRFVTVYKAVLKDRENEIETIDARYPNGVAVRWLSANG